MTSFMNQPQEGGEAQAYQGILLFGPTAAGKSALALTLAKHLGGAVINADSRQIYRGFPILNACPTPVERALVPHFLYEELDPKQRFSAADYALRAREVLAQVQAAGLFPLVVGGTGFYFKALQGGLSEIPPSDAALEAQATALPAAARHAALAALDAPSAARLHPHDTQRVVRALVVAWQTGRPLSHWQQGGGPALPGRWLKVGLMPPRAVLHENLRRRWEELMPAAGVVAEARALVAAGYTGEEPGLKGLAIPLWLAHARGELDLATVTQQALAADRQYAKRQCTWLKNSFGAELVLETSAPEAVLARVTLGGGA